MRALFLVLACACYAMPVDRHSRVLIACPDAFTSTCESMTMHIATNMSPFSVTLVVGSNDMRRVASEVVPSNVCIIVNSEFKFNFTRASCEILENRIAILVDDRCEFAPMPYKHNSSYTCSVTFPQTSSVTWYQCV